MADRRAARVLVVEDDVSQAKLLVRYLAHRGYHATQATSVEEGERALTREPYDVVLVDWHLPGGRDGVAFIVHVRERYPFTQCVMITAFGSIERAVEAMKAGAYHYLTKPIDLEELVVVIERAVREVGLEREVEILRRKLGIHGDLPSSHVIAESARMREVLLLVNKVAQTDVTVLVRGESGTGKQIIAELVHRLSPRSDKPLFTINCAAIPEGLLESELFGHERGAFTGADRTKLGLFEMVHGGTMFLDEIGDLALPLQAKLLRVLQDGRFFRIGGTQELVVDVRIVAATNRDLESMVRDGRFREDLYWRLNVFPIRIPPLRERREDILPLAHHFLERYAQKLGKPISGITREGAERLLMYSFPGNVRELEHLIERAVILADSTLLTSQDLTVGDVTVRTPSCRLGESRDVCALWRLPLPDAVRLLEERRIEEAMEKSGGVKTRAAEILGISERALRYKLGRDQEGETEGVLRDDSP